MKICPECQTEYLDGEAFCPDDGARLLEAERSSASPPGDPLVDQVIDKYRVVRRIGEGGMGLVYEAVHTVIEKRVAIKVLRDDLSRKPEVVERFQREAKSASRIGSEHIVDISDFGVTPGGASYFVMEFLEGEDLASRLERERTLAPEAVVDILVQCCAALGAAHRLGIVHRDVKPENIFLVSRGGRDDFVKIVDFGIAKMSELEAGREAGKKLTKTGVVFGTPEYMSPEQAKGKDLDHRVDIYALGVILFECLTGRVPFAGDSFMGILTQHIFDEMPRMVDVNPDVDCPPALEAVMTRATMKDPAERYSSAEAMAADLRAALGGEVGRETYEVFERSRADGGETVRVGQAPEARRPRWVRLAAVGALAIAGAAGARFAWVESAPTSAIEPAHRGEIPGEDEGSGEDGEALAVAIDPVAGEDGAAEEEGAAEEAPAWVPVRVETVPEGAVARVEGTDRSCEPTPCELMARDGEEISIAANRGASAGGTTVTPEGRTTVQLLLSQPKPKRARPASARTSKSTTSTSTQARRGDDLKVPDIFR